MAKAKFVEHVEGLGALYVVYAPFDKQVSALKEAGIESPESVRDASWVRLHSKFQAYVRTCHAPICAKDSPVIIARVSPAIGKPEMLETIVRAHRKFHYPVFDNDKSIYAQWEKIAKQDAGKKIPEERRAIILPQRGDYRMHRDSDEAKFLWQDTREAYFKEKIREDNVVVWQIPTNAIDSQDGTIVNYVSFDRPERGSALGFRGRYLNYVNSRAFGVLK